MLDSSGKIPDGIFAGSRDLCYTLDEIKYYSEAQGYEFPMTCDSEFNGQSLSFLRGKIPIPFGNTKAWGSVEGCIGVKATFKPDDPLYDLFQAFRLSGFAGIWTVQKFQVPMPSQSERDLLLNSTHLNSVQPRIAPAFGLIPEILPEWLKFIWDAIGNNDVST